MSKSDPAEEIQSLKQRIAELESKEAAYKHGERLLQAFNQASLAMSVATSPEEIFDTVAKTLKGLGVSSVIFSTDQNQENVIVNSITFESQAISAAEKLVGIESIGFTIPIDMVDVLRISIRERRTHLSRDSKGILHQMMPEHLKKFSGQVAKILNIPIIISAPLISGDDVVGLLYVHSEELVAEDIPLVTAFAHQVASSWRKSQLYQQALQDISERKENEQAYRQRATQLALLNDIGEQIVAVLDLERVFQRAVQFVQESFGYHHVSVFTLDPQLKMLFLRAKAGGFDDLFPPEHALKIGQGMVGWAAENNQTLLSNDVTSEDQNTNLYPDTLPTRSELCVPIYIGEQVIGVLDAQSPTTNAFDDSDVTVMQTLAGQIAIAIDNARLHAATERQLKETQALASINQALNETLDLDRLLQLMADSIGQIIPHIERVVVHLYDEENSTLVPAAVAGVAPERKPHLQMQAGQGIAGQVIDTGLSINVRDTQQDQRFIPIDGATYLRSLLVVPITGSTTILGTISTSSTKPEAFTNEDEYLLSMIGVQASIALHNARLYAATHRRLAESNTLFYISNLIADSAELDVETILLQVVDQLWLDFGYYHVHVYLIDQVSGALIANQGSSTIGKQLKEEGYQFTSEEGIVGYAASVGEAFMTNNVAEVLFFMPNPLLPHTSAEFAAPLRVRGQILGVLDVLHQPPKTFDADDFRFLTTVADQIAVVLDKALLYNQLQEALEKEQSTRSQLVQTEKLAAIGRLIASVAHELNNPLQAIQNALYLVKLEENLSPQAAEDLQVAFDEGTRMAGLIARLRDTYRPVVSADYQSESVDILTEEVRNLIGTHLRHSNVSLEFTPNPDLPKTPIIRDQIKQVILNLCINAIESMPQGGKLTIFSTYHPDVEEIHLDISDTGPGMTSEVQAKIFEPFFTTKEGGTGLGLAVSYEIAQNHGGNIKAKNNPGPGATFTLILPCKPLVLE